MSEEKTLSKTFESKEFQAQLDEIQSRLGVALHSNDVGAVNEILNEVDQSFSAPQRLEIMNTAGSRSSGPMLHKALDTGDLEIIKAIAHSPNTDINVKDQDGTPAFLKAARGLYLGYGGLKSHDEDAHRAIFDVFKNAPGIDLNATDYQGYGAWHEAVVSGHLELADEILLLTPDVDKDHVGKDRPPEKPNGFGIPASGNVFLRAIPQNNAELLHDISEIKGVDIFATDNHGHNGVHEAITNHAPNSLRAVLDLGLSPNSQKKPPLMLLTGRSNFAPNVRERSEENLDILLAHPETDLFATDRSGKTARDKAQEYGNDYMVDKIDRAIQSRSTQTLEHTMS